MRSEPSQEKAKDLGLEPGPEVRVRYAVSVERLIHLENAQHGAKSVINVENKNHFSTQCRSRQSGGGDRQSHSTSRGCKGQRQMSTVHVKK